MKLSPQLAIGLAPATKLDDCTRIEAHRAHTANAIRRLNSHTDQAPNSYPRRNVGCGNGSSLLDLLNPGQHPTALAFTRFD